MQYRIAPGAFTRIAETRGTLQNNDRIHAMEVSDRAEADSGILLYPGRCFVFDKGIYVRSVGAPMAIEARVIPFVLSEAGGVAVATTGGTGGSADDDDGNVATDGDIKQITDGLYD